MKLGEVFRNIGWLIVLAMLWVCSCGDDLPRQKPGQAEATHVIWVEQYGATFDPPTVEWVEADHLDCFGNAGFKILQGDGTEQCIAGIFYYAPYDALVAWPASTLSFADTALAHELCHAWSDRITGAGDSGHTGPCFAPGGYVERANQALRTAGL